MNTKRVYLLSALVALIGILALCFYMAYPGQYAEQMLVENASIHDNELEHEAHDGREVAAHYFAGYTGISSMVVHPDGKQVFALIDGAVISFDYALGRTEAVVPGRAVASIAVSPDGGTLGCGENTGRVSLWDLRTKRTLKRLEGSNDHITALAFAPRDGLLGAGDATGLITLWDVTNGRQLATWSQRKRMIFALAFSADSLLVAAASQDRGVSVWDVSSKEHLADLEGVDPSRVRSLTFLGEKPTLVYGTRSGSIGFWNARSGILTDTLEGANYDLWLGFACTKDGQTLAVECDRDYPKLNLWNLSSRHVFAKLDVGNAALSGLAFTPDGSRLAAAGCTGMVATDDRQHEPCLKVWNLH